MTRTISIGKRLAGAALAILSLLALAACDGNSNPPDRPTLRVDLASIKQQLGGGAGGGALSTRGIGQSGSPATTQVYSLVVGAVVITFTDQALASDTTLSDTLTDALEEDVKNSIVYFKIVDLPTAEDFVEFNLPPEAAGFWQVAAIATRAPISTFDDLSQDSIGVYYGFDGVRRRTVGTTENVNLDMRRACLITTPPLGCAQYNLDRNSMVSPGVEIVGVVDSQNASIAGTTPLPIVVRDTVSTNCATGCSPAAAAALLNAMTVANSGITGAVIKTTHQLSPGQPSNCTATPQTAANLIANCGEEDFVTTF